MAVYHCGPRVPAVGHLAYKSSSIRVVTKLRGRNCATGSFIDNIRNSKPAMGVALVLSFAGQNKLGSLYNYYGEYLILSYSVLVQAHFPLLVASA